MATGDSNDIVSRVKRLIPNGWFGSSGGGNVTPGGATTPTPILDAVLGGLADTAASLYNFIVYTKTQSRVATSTGPFLDIISFDFLGRNLPRNSRNDSAYRQVILSTILQERVTRKGMINAVTSLTGNKPTIVEPWSTQDCGAFDVGNLAYDEPNGGCYGETDLPAQAFLTVSPPGQFGVPMAGGFDLGQDALDTGSSELIDSTLVVGQVTNNDIYKVIAITKPTGSIIWTSLTPNNMELFLGPVLSPPSLIFTNTTDSQYLALGI